MHVQNAALAGGVIIRANADFLVQPYIALVMGSVAGIVSTLGYYYVQVNKTHLISLCSFTIISLEFNIV